MRRPTARPFFRTPVAALLAAGAIALQASVSPAAALINNTGLASPVLTITFDSPGFPSQTPITTQYAALGVTFSPGLFYDTQPGFFPTQALANYTAGGNNNPASILFPGGRTSAAFALMSNPGTTTFTALLGGVEVETFSAPTALSVLPSLDHASDYFGFTGITFDEIRVMTSGAQGNFQLDNVQLGPAAIATAVPLPSTAAGGATLLGVVATRRRRRTAPA